VRIVAAGLFASIACLAAGFEAAALAGYGFSDGEEGPRIGSAIVGAQLRWPAGAGNSLQADYARVTYRGTTYTRHFVTGSWVRQWGRARVRPFFQAGAGFYVQRTDFGRLGVPPPFNRHTGIDPAVVLGAGATVDLAPAAFLRPMLRASCFVVGCTLTPAVAVGYRF
jgi:hypothetical protein